MKEKKNDIILFENQGVKKEEFIISQNRKGNILYFIISFIFTIFGLYGIFIHIKGVNLILQIIIKIIYLIDICFFGYGCIFFIKKNKKKQEILIINDKGITDNSTAISLGFIPWEDIENVYIDGVLGNQFIELKIKNEEKYLKNINFMKKILINLNKKMGHQIVCITLNTTNYSLDYVLEKIKEYRK